MLTFNPRSLLPTDDSWSPRVLFASGEAAWREQARAWLRTTGCDCYTAASTQEILALAACGGFGAALIDVTNPRLGGQDLFQRLHREIPELVLIALAPVDRRSEAAWIYESGGEGMLLLPFNEHELQVQVAHNLRRHRRLAEALEHKQSLEREARERTAEVRRREEELALRLVSASEYRDNETGAHIRRIGMYTGVLAEALGWDRQSADDVRIAATMHDIGKIGVPDTILLKPGKLTKEEFEVIKQHTVIGAGILEGSDIPLLNLAREIAWCHHEKWNGSGYPRGLSGEDIPEAARIVAIADVYDALVHARVYKPAMPEEEAIATMQADRGRHFDPRIFDCFLEVVDQFRQIRETFTEEAARRQAQASQAGGGSSSGDLPKHRSGLTPDAALALDAHSANMTLLPADATT